MLAASGCSWHSPVSSCRIAPSGRKHDNFIGGLFASDWTCSWSLAVPVIFISTMIGGYLQTEPKLVVGSLDKRY